EGSRVYFLADADLDGAGPATPGDCATVHDAFTGSGECNLYLWEGGKATFIARLNPTTANQEALAWVQTSALPGGTGFAAKTSQVSPDGRVLLLLSHQQLTGYENNGVGELYRFEIDSGWSCASCPPSGVGATVEPDFGKINFPSLGPRASDAPSIASHILSTDGKRVFFETTESLVAGDSSAGCPQEVACTDVYEWEAPGAGTCEQGGPGFSPLNQGCLYLISPDNGTYPSYFADASASGDDVFFFTHESLVGSDGDE